MLVLRLKADECLRFMLAGNELGRVEVAQVSGTGSAKLRLSFDSNIRIERAPAPVRGEETSPQRTRRDAEKNTMPQIGGGE